ncbi:MAG: hypothetical protein FD131_334 [Rhodocyclaceae bacterium]|nr:MAG: hypothetical protein FD131_334 [Rhodocyclaceae bacterium]
MPRPKRRGCGRLGLGGFNSPVRRNWRFLVSWLGFPPCWRAYFLLLRQKKVAKAPCGFLALLGGPGGCGTRATPSNSPRRRPPAFLRCSAPLMGTRKASTGNRVAGKNDSYGQPGKTAKNEIHSLIPDASLLPLTRGRPGGGWFPGPLEGAEQRRVWRKRGEDCLRAQPEFRSPRQSRVGVAQGTRAAGTNPGSPSSLATFFLAKQKKVRPPARRNPKPIEAAGFSLRPSPPNKHIPLLAKFSG